MNAESSCRALRHRQSECAFHERQTRTTHGSQPSFCRFRSMSSMIFSGTWFSWYLRWWL